MSAREVEDVLAGRQPDGRADLAPLAEVAAVLHASREVEPPPPISDTLRAQMDQGIPRSLSATPRRRRHRPRHMQAVTPGRSALAAYRRPVASVAAAAAVLIGLVAAANGGHLPREVHSAVADVGSAIGLDLFQRDDAAGTDKSTPATTSTSTTTPTTAPTTTAPPQTTTTAPPPTTQVPAAAAPEGADGLPFWLTPEFWEHYGQFGGPGGSWGGDGRGDDYGRDGDRDGDGDGTGGGSGSGEDQPGTAGPYDHDQGTTPPPTTAAPTSTSPSTAPTPTGQPPTT